VTRKDQYTQSDMRFTNVKKRRQTNANERSRGETEKNYFPRKGEKREQKIIRKENGSFPGILHELEEKTSRGEGGLSGPGEKAMGI